MMNENVTQVLKESFKIYCAVNDGIINLVEMVPFIIYQLSLHLNHRWI